MINSAECFLPRDMLARYSGLCYGLVSARQSVRRRYCTKSDKRRITQTTPLCSPVGTLVFCCQRSWRSSNGVTPQGGAKYRYGRLKSAIFD